MGKVRIFIGGFFSAIVIILSVFISIIPYILLRIVALKSLAIRYLRVNMVALANSILFFLGVKVQVNNKENLPGPYEKRVYISNHLSILDVVVFVAKLKPMIGFITKVEVKYIPILNFWLWANKSILLDRKSAKSSIKAMQKGVETIKNHWSICVYPEGTRNKQGDISDFKHGSFKLALRSKAPIIPVVTNNTQYAFEKRTGWFCKKVYLSVLKPIEVANLSEEETKNIHIYSRDLIKKEFDKYAKA